MLTEPHLKRIFRLSAWYDIIVTAGFATPWSFVFMIGLIADASERLGLPGTMLAPDTFHIFFANLLGSVVLVWSVARLKLNILIMVRYDAVARWLFSIWMIYALANGASFFILFLLIPEATLAVLQSLPLRKRAAVL